MVAAPFQGGEKLVARLRSVAGKLAKGGTLRVGFLEGTTYPDGTSVPMVATVQEWGSISKKIPPRPFFRPMIAKCSPGWGPILAAQLERCNFDAGRALKQLGNQMEGELQQSIKDVTAPALADATVAARIARRKSKRSKINPITIRKPLIDTGIMLRSVRSEVTE